MKNNQSSGKKGGFVFFFLLLFAICILGFFANALKYNGNSYSMGRLEKAVEEGRVSSVAIEQFKDSHGGRLDIILTDGTHKVLNVVDCKDTENYLRENGIDAIIGDVPEDSWFLNYIFPALLILGICAFFFVMFVRSAGTGGNSEAFTFGKSRARMILDNTKRLNDVAGLKEEKEDLNEIIQFLKEPERFTKVGAKIPKGVLLEGPPGTGKTLLAKAIAGEAGVPFFSISGSDFVEMFVGVGASRVRDLFVKANENKPCIIFIDEIDAVARRRGTGVGGGHDEREQTLNQLLVEMDGFEENSGIIVLAATNRIDILDPAILRPGRFDRKIMIGRPDVGGREEILNVHAKDKPLGDDVDIKKIAQTTAGFTGADLANLLNEAAINAAKRAGEYIVAEDVTSAFLKVGIGTEKKSKIVSDKEKRITAYHESGHAILFHVLPEMDPVYTISIIPTGTSAAGYTMPLPENDNMFYTKGRMKQDIMVSLGGRIAEEIIFDDITTGASSDINKATHVARNMVMRYGMSDKIGTINYNDDSDDVFIGKDLAHAKSFSETTATEIDNEVKSIIDECYKKAKEIILQNIDILHASANLLLEKERVTREEFEALFGEKIDKNTSESDPSWLIKPEI